MGSTLATEWYYCGQLLELKSISLLLQMTQFVPPPNDKKRRGGGGGGDDDDEAGAADDEDADLSKVGVLHWHDQPHPLEASLPLKFFIYRTRAAIKAECH